MTSAPPPCLSISIGSLHMVTNCFFPNSVFASCMVLMSALVCWNAKISMSASRASSLLFLALIEPTLWDLSHICSFFVCFGMAILLRPFGPLLPWPGMSASPIHFPVCPSVHVTRKSANMNVGLRVHMLCLSFLFS